MATNLIQYEGRLINNKEQCKVSRSKSGNIVLDIVVAEQFQEKNSNAPDKYKRPEKAPDDYVDTTTAWHRVRVLGAMAEQFATDPQFNHGAIIEVSAAYREGEPFEAKSQTRDGVYRTNRDETVFSDREDGTHWIAFKTKRDGEALVAYEDHYGAMWDGESALPALGGSGPRKGREYSEDEGF